MAHIAFSGPCYVGVDATGNVGITDVQDPNTNPTPHSAASQGNQFTHKRVIETAPTDVALDASGTPQIFTHDLTRANGIGNIDTIEVTFEQPLVTNTISNSLASLFTVSNTVNGVTTNAHVTGVEAGQGRPADGLVDSVYVHIDHPSAWNPSNVTTDGSITPTIAFNGSSCALKASVPTGANYTSCVNSFSDPSIDKIGPEIVSASTIDSNHSGFINQIAVNFSKPIASGAAVNGWSVNGVNATSLMQSGSTITLAIAQTNLKTDATPSVLYNSTASGANITDASAAAIPADTQTVTASDGVSPRLLTATTGSSQGDGNTDTVTLQFSEPVVASVLHATDFTVGTDNVHPSSISVNGAVVTLSVSEGTTKSFPVSFVGTLKDLDAHPGSNTDGFTLSAAQVHDGVAPVKISYSTDPAGVAKAQTVTLTTQYSEPLKTTVTPTVTIGGKAVQGLSDSTHTNGYLNSDPSTWVGTVTFVAADCTDENGCAKAINLAGFQDAAGNTAASVMAGTITVDTIAPDAATSETSNAIQQAGYPSIAANTIGAHTSNLSITANITSNQVNTLGDPSGGSAMLLLDGTPMTPNVSISNIAASATSITLQTAFQDATALQNAISAGNHTFKIELCDTAGNCSTSNGVSVTAQYTPVTPTLTAPNSGSFNGGDSVCITWTTPTATGYTTELRYSTDSGQTFPNLIATNPTQAACGSGTGYQWTVPGLNTSHLRVEVRTIDQYANDAASASSSDMSVQTVTQTVLSLTASASSIVNGASETLSGSLTGNGFAVAGKTVHIQSKPAGASSFRNLTDVTTGNNGAFSYTFRPTSNALYQAVFNTDGPYVGSASSIAKVSDAVSIPTWTGTWSLRRGQTFTVRGSVSPSKSGKPVYFEVYRSGKWTILSRSTLGSSSTFSFSYRSTSAVKLLFRVIYYGDFFNAGNVSRNFFVSWR
ncbi:MAG: hypothetical protein ACYDCC_02170 [Actinomycetota bacterium]